MSFGLLYFILRFSLTNACVSSFRRLDESGRDRNREREQRERERERREQERRQKEGDDRRDIQTAGLKEEEQAIKEAYLGKKKVTPFVHVAVLPGGPSAMFPLRILSSRTRHTSDVLGWAVCGIRLSEQTSMPSLAVCGMILRTIY